MGKYHQTKHTFRLLTSCEWLMAHGILWNKCVSGIENFLVFFCRLCNEKNLTFGIFSKQTLWWTMNIYWLKQTWLVSFEIANTWTIATILSDLQVIMNGNQQNVEEHNILQQSPGPSEPNGSQQNSQPVSLFRINCNEFAQKPIWCISFADKL